MADTEVAKSIEYENPNEFMDVIEFIKTLKKVDGTEASMSRKQSTESSGNCSKTGSKDGSKKNSTEKLPSSSSRCASKERVSLLKREKKIEKRISASDLLQNARNRFAMSKNKDPNFHSLELPEDEDERIVSPSGDMLRMPQINSLKISEKSGGSEPTNVSNARYS